MVGKRVSAFSGVPAKSQTSWGLNGFPIPRGSDRVGDKRRVYLRVSGHARARGTHLPARRGGPSGEAGGGGDVTSPLAGEVPPARPEGVGTLPPRSPGRSLRR